MGTFRKPIVCFCILFLAISWPEGSFGAPASVLPLLKQYFTSDISNQQISPRLSLSNCDCYTRPSAFPIPSYETTGSISGDSSAARRQQLLNEATILLKQLSSSAVPTDTSMSIATPCNHEIENQEKILLQSLINRLGAYKKNSIVLANPSSSLPAISEVTYNSITNHYLQIRVLIIDLLTPKDVEIVQPAFDSLYKTFVKIITGQLLNVELPNLCSATLALNTELKATDAPIELQEEVTYFIKSLTEALTGQSQVTILGLCDCLNNLETSVVSVVENDKSQKLQYLLSNLVEAVTNAVVSGGDVGCNVIDIVQRYVTSIKQAVQEDANVRARQIYSSVLSFEEELYKVLLASKPIAIETTTSGLNTTSSNLETEEYYLTVIEELSKAIFGSRTHLVKSAVEILLNIKKSEDPSSEDQPTYPDCSEATLVTLKKITDLLKSVHSDPQTDSTHVVEAIVELLSTLPQTDVLKVLNALDPVPEDKNSSDKIDDTTAIVSDGEIFIIKEQLVQQTDAYGNVIDVVKSGTYKLVDPETKVSWSGSYTVQVESIQAGPHGNVYYKKSGIYDVNELDDDYSSSSSSPRVKRQANFELDGKVIAQVDENGNSEVIETGTYLLTDSTTGISKSGNFVVENIVSKSNPDGTTEIIKSGLLYVDKPGATSPSEQPSLEPGSGYFLFNDHIFESPDSEGNYGKGTYNLKNPKTDEYLSGTYTIQQLNSTKNPDGSVDSKISGLIYVDGVNRDSSPDNFDKILYVVNGSQVTFYEHLAYVTDIHGQVSPIITRVFSETDPTTEITKTGNYTVDNIITTYNPDGSMDITKFGKVFDINFVIPSTDSTTTPSSSSEPTETPTIKSKHLPISKDSFQALIDRFNPAVKPVHPGAGTSTDHQTYVPLIPVEEPSSTTCSNSIDYDATSIVSNGTTFIIDQLITPVLDSEGNVIDEIIMGTYHLMDIRTNISWSGALEVDDYSIKTTYPGKTEVTASVTFDVTPPDNHYDSTIIANLTIEYELNVDVDKNGTVKSSEEGTYCLTDPNTGATKSGTFVVENTVSRSQPGGAIEFIKSGLLFVDEPDTTSSSPVEESLIPGYDGYFLFDDHILNVPDKYGNYGDGVYSIKDSTTNEHLTGTYEIRKASTTNNADGSIDMKREGVIYVDGFDPDCNSSSSLSPSIIRNGATFMVHDHLEYATDAYGHKRLIGYGQLTQIDPETGVIESGSHVILNVVTTNDGDGSINVRKFGAFPIDNDCDSSEDSTSTTQAPTYSTSTTQAPTHSWHTTKKPKYSTTTTQAPTHSTSTTQAPRHSWHTTKKPKHLTTTTQAPTHSTSTTQAPTHSTSTTQAPKHSWHTTKTPKYSTTTTQAPTHSTSTTQAPTHSWHTTKTPKYTTTTTQEPTHSTSTTQAPKHSWHTTKTPKYSTTTTQAPTYSTSTTQAPTTNKPTKPYVLKTDHFETLVNSLNPIKPTSHSSTLTSPDKSLPKSTDGANVSGNPIYDATAIVTNGANFIIDGQVVPQLDAEGNTVGLLKTGSYSIRDSRTNVSWSGSFEVEDCLIKSINKGQIYVTGSGTFDVNLPDNSHSSTTKPKNEALFTITDLVSVVVDETSTSRATENGTYCLTNPTTGDSTYGTFVVANSLSKMNPDGSIDLVKSGTLYVDEPRETTPSNEPSPIKYGGYFLTDQHLLSVPDCDGNYGTGIINIKDPETNEYTSGTYIIQEASTVNNTDGTVDVKTSGLIYVDSSRSSSPLISSEPSLAIINGAQFTFIDHLSYVTDVYGHVNLVGTGEFTQTDPKTNTSRSGKYIIKDIINTNNPDGSQDGIESGIFYYTTDSDSNTNPSSTTPKLGSDETLTELNGYLKALFNSLDALKVQHNKPGKATPPTTSGSTSKSLSDYGITSDHLVLPRSNVVSAINGQCLSPGDVVAVQTNSGTALLATIRDSYSPVTFYVTNLADLTGKFATANKVWTIPENDFSKQDRSLFDTVLKSSSSPCDA